MPKKPPQKPNFIIPTAGKILSLRRQLLQSLPKKTGPLKQASANRRLFLKAYEATYGNISASCRVARIHRTTYHRWKRRYDRDKLVDPSTLSRGARENIKFFERLALIEPEEFQLDALEFGLMGRVAEGDTTAIIFGLKTKGRRRGYIERPDLIPAENLTDDTLTEELHKLRKRIESVAAQFQSDYPTELRDFLKAYGEDLNPRIRIELANELEQ